MDYRRAIPYIVIVFVILVTLAYQTISYDPLTSFSKNLEHTVGVILNFTLVVGVIIQLYTHARNINERRPRWSYSLASWAMFIVFILFALGTGGTGSQLYQGLYKGTLVPSHWAAEGFGIFLFFTATWRGFRTRSIESAFMCVLCVISLFAAAPATRALYGPILVPVFNWLTGVLATGVSRSILITAMIGAIAFMVRVLIGKERILGG